jgi:hypothetical protein
MCGGYAFRALVFIVFESYFPLAPAVAFISCVPMNFCCAAARIFRWELNIHKSHIFIVRKQLSSVAPPRSFLMTTVMGAPRELAEKLHGELLDHIAEHGC